mgnify:CR=1 FL=1
MLVSAFASKDFIMKAYHHAVEENIVSSHLVMRCLFNNENQL